MFTDRCHTCCRVVGKNILKKSDTISSKTVLHCHKKYIVTHGPDEITTVRNTNNKKKNWKKVDRTAAITFPYGTDNHFQTKSSCHRHHVVNVML